MSRPLPSQNEPSAEATSTHKTSEASQAAASSHLSASPPVVLPPHPEEEPAFSYEEEEQPDPATAFVAPFQLSGAMLTMPAQAFDQTSHMPTSPQAFEQVSAPTAVPAPSAPPARRRPRLSLRMIAMVVCVVVLIGVFVIPVLVPGTPSLQMQSPGSSPIALHAPEQPPAKSPSASIPPQMHGMSGSVTGTPSSDGVPHHLPNGWTTAGLQTGDGIEALRTAVTFTDREMSLDYRSVGTRTVHAGTFTAATFVMTAAAVQRFEHNDIRESSNALFDTVAATQLIRVVITPQAHLVAFTQHGQQQFAQVDVSFELWQSRIDPTHPQQHVEGIEPDPATQQPRIHHMMVLLLRVLPQNAGNPPAMGGTGWLVSTYALDVPIGTTLDIVEPA